MFHFIILYQSLDFFCRKIKNVQPPSESNGNSSKETIELSLPGNDQFIDPLPASQSTTICHESSGVKSIASPALGSETTDTNRV